jgi:hypothetical protein
MRSLPSDLITIKHEVPGQPIRHDQYPVLGVHAGIYIPQGRIIYICHRAHGASCGRRRPKSAGVEEFPKNIRSSINKPTASEKCEKSAQ